MCSLEVTTSSKSTIDLGSVSFFTYIVIAFVPKKYDAELLKLGINCREVLILE